jgi:hypothetical protein
MKGAYDERKELAESSIYSPSLSIEENLKNPKALSWHWGCLCALGLTIRPPTYQSPS